VRQAGFAVGVARPCSGRRTRFPGRRGIGAGLRSMLRLQLESVEELGDGPQASRHTIDGRGEVEVIAPAIALGPHQESGVVGAVHSSSRSGGGSSGGLGHAHSSA